VSFRQRGSKVKPDEFTFDSAHMPRSLTREDGIRRLVSEKSMPISAAEPELSQGLAKSLPGVNAFFGDK